MSENLLGHLIRILGSFIDQGQNLHQALLVMGHNFSAASGEVKERFAVTGENSAGRYLSHLCQRLQIILQRIGALRLRIEADVGRDAWQDMIGSKENAVFFAEKADVSIRMSWRPEHAVLFPEQVNAVAIFNQGDGLVRWDTQNVAHHVGVLSGDPEFGTWQAML